MDMQHTPALLLHIDIFQVKALAAVPRGVDKEVEGISNNAPAFRVEMKEF